MPKQYKVTVDQSLKAENNENPAVRRGRVAIVRAVSALVARSNTDFSRKR